MTYSDKKIILLCLLVLALVSVAYALFGHNFLNYNQYRDKQTQTVDLNHIQKENKTLADVDSFPFRFPFEENANVYENYEVSKAYAPRQYVRSYESSKPVEQNFTIFSEYFTENGWKIETSNQASETYQYVIASKNSQAIQVGITRNSQSDVVEVEVSLTDI